MDLAMLRTLATGADLPTLEELTPRPAWMAHGSCRDHPEVNFYPDRGEDVRPAKALCAVCPVSELCLDYAVTAGEQFGIWGGVGVRDRRRLRRARRDAA